MGGRETPAESSGAEAAILAELNVGAKAPTPKEKRKAHTRRRRGAPRSHTPKSDPRSDGLRWPSLQKRVLFFSSLLLFHLPVTLNRTCRAKPISSSSTTTPTPRRHSPPPFASLAMKPPS